MTVATKGRRTAASLRTMARFLEAAEAIFGTHGYEGTTVRDIAERSGANLGTLKHYWGSKRDLFRDLMERRLRPVHDETAARLAALDPRTNGGAVLDARAVVACMVEPAFLVGVPSPPDLDFRDPRARGRFHRFFGRCLSDPAAEIVEDLNEMFAATTLRFYGLMQLACPDLTQAELNWRINCVFGAVTFSQLYSERIGRFLGSQPDVDDELASQWVMHVIDRGIAARPLRGGSGIRTNLAPLRPRRGSPDKSR